MELEPPRISAETGRHCRIGVGRSEFIRRALLQALIAAEEERTREAYRRVPQTEAVAFDPEVFEEWEVPGKGGHRVVSHARRSAKKR